MTGRLWRELLNGRKPRNRSLLSLPSHLCRGQHSFFPTLPAVRMFILNFRITIQATPHNWSAPSMYFFKQHDWNFNTPGPFRSKISIFVLQLPSSQKMICSPHKCLRLLHEKDVPGFRDQHQFSIGQVRRPLASGVERHSSPVSFHDQRGHRYFREQRTEVPISKTLKYRKCHEKTIP